jgi:maltose alpha-D-glucosyltransferase/alpha-amylase
VYVRAFYDSNADGHGDLRGLTQRLGYLKELGVTCLWLLPVYPSPLKDDGYDISDYFGIHPDYGTLQDFKELLETAHAHGLRVITDLVLNHTSDAHPWFQAARADRQSPYRDYYVWSDTDQKYQDARIIFLDTETSNWTWDKTAGQYYWHRFYASQPDLNFDNPAVQEEIRRIIKFWLDLGVDGFRADAVPYLFERQGTNCENLHETHTYLKELRCYIDEHYSDRILLCEANQWPQDVRAYFGDGDECHMAFHFPLMPRIFMALRKANTEPIRWALEQTPPIPQNCQWCTFLRNHDELTLEMVTEEERQWMWREYAPEARMRLNLGIRRRLAPLLDNDRQLIELANAILFTLPGAPIIYYGDEIGMGDNIYLPDRNGVRTPMQWSADRNAGFSSASQLYAPVITDEPYSPREVNVSFQQAETTSLWHKIHAMISYRKTHPALLDGDITWLGTGNHAISAHLRSAGQSHLLCLNNLGSQPTRVRIPLPSALPSQLTDLFSNEAFQAEGGVFELALAPYQYLWLSGNK